MHGKEIWLRVSLTALTAVMCVGSVRLHAQTAPTTAPSAATKPVTSKAEGLLNSGDTANLLPASVYFRGQTAPVQTRNSGGIRFSDDGIVLFALVDSSGYSSSIREKYQAYLLTEVPLEIDGHHLPAGAYGCGFIAPDAFVVMDIGGHDLFSAHTTKDPGLRRPTPLQVRADDAASKYRVYSGRTYVTFTRASS
jgi:hypothetical protein